MLLENKVALVTGASRGIGRAIALKFASEGASIAVNYAGNTEAAEKVKAEIEALGGKCLLIKANVADIDEARNMVEEVVKDFGTVDVLVNNAGITRDSLLARMKDDDFKAVISTNLKSVFHTSQAVTKLMMKKRYGRIINMSSVVGIVGNAGQANYAAAKAGVIGFTKSLAKELASRNITVNAIAPGFIRTDMTNSLSEDAKEAALTGIPLKRMGEPEEVAEAALFLASDKAAYITGQVLNVDGGMVM